MTAYRVVATDLDGTIIPHGGTVSEHTLSVFQQLQAQGIPTVFATGRPPRWLTPVIEATNHQGYVVSTNGALTLNMADDSIVDVQALSTDVIHTVAKVMRQHVPDVALAVETATELRVEDHYDRVRGHRRNEGLTPTASQSPRQLVAPRVEELVDSSAFIKMLAVSSILSPDELLHAGRRHLGDLVSITHSSKGVAMLEISAAGVSKARALERLITPWGIDSSQVIAFGDMPNDVEMLQWAGVGYAMADGHPEAIAAAGRTAPPATEDGVAQVLRTIFDLEGVTA